MPTYITLLLIAIGLLAIVGLSLFIRKQWHIIKNPPSAETGNRQEAPGDYRLSTAESIRIIAITILEKQIELSEGCIRIRVLLDHLAPEMLDKPEYRVFDEVYQKLSHMPTHEARKNTDKRFIQKLDIQRYRIERENEARILDATKALLNDKAIAA